MHRLFLSRIEFEHTQITAFNQVGGRGSYLKTCVGRAIFKSEGYVVKYKGGGC